MNNMRAGRGWAEFEKRGFFGTPFLSNAAQSYHLTNFNEYCTQRIKLVSFSAPRNPIQNILPQRAPGRKKYLLYK